MPVGETFALRPISRQELRTFHIAGRGLDQALPEAALHPAELDQMPQPARLESAYPVYVTAKHLPKPFAEVLQGVVQIPELIARAFRDAAAGGDLIPVAHVRDRVLALREGFSEAEIERLRGTIPREGWLVPFTANALPLLYAATLAAARRQARERFLGNVVRQCERLKELLRLEDSHSPSGSTPAAICAALGTEAAHFDAAVLAGAFDRKAAGTHRMEPERRQRIAGILATLERAIEDSSREPVFWLFHSALAPASATALGGRLRQCADSFEAALDFCDQRLAAFGRVLRALRAARLEMESAFDPAVHEEWLQRFDWQSADPEELASLPAFVVLEPAEWLARTSFASFGRLLRSGRPVHILIPCQGLQTQDQDGDLSGFMPDFGYLSIAHREAFVLQSSLSRLDHLTEGLSGMARSLRPAVAVVSVPPARGNEAPESEAGAWLESSLLHLSRAFPLYRYDPDRGETWMERFELLTGPPPGALTAAHAAAVSNDLRRHFRVIPASAWDQEQMELTEYLERYWQHPPLAVPFLWVVDEQGTRQRAIVTRELVNLSRDRRRAWRIFEELAGVKNAYVEAAVLRTRGEVQEKVKLEGAAEAIHRVVAMLTGPLYGGLSLTAGQAIATAQTPQPASQALPQSAPAAAPVQEAEEASAEPYIDSFLCTSCNDCMKVNAQMFLYDANKQAYIGDARAGTFAELVKAAEGCPGKCIHPGRPRPDDPTATRKVLVRAAKFR